MAASHVALSADKSTPPDNAVPKRLPEPAVTEMAVRLIKALANPVRFRALCLLRRGEMSVRILADVLGVSQSDLSYHLRVLRQARLVAMRQDGCHVYYRLADERSRAFLSSALDFGSVSAGRPR